MKTLIYTTAVNSSNRSIRDTDIFNVTKQTWEHYCNQHEIDFYVIDTDLIEDTSPHWYRYWIFDLKPGYDRYMYVDNDIMAHWNAPNIFDIYNKGSVYAVQDNSGLCWIWEGIQIYKEMFPDVNLEWDTYFNSGVLLFDNEHREIIDAFKTFYIENHEVIKEYREKYRKGFDQTIFNYFLKWADVKVTLISEKWNLFHLIRREILHNGYFIDMGHFWHFNGLERNVQTQIIDQIWNHVKHNYKNK